jgi:excisionase family DNA binding protein
MPESDLMTAQQVAELLDVSTRTVHRMADDGRLRIEHKLPGETGAYLFARVDVRKVGVDRLAQMARRLDLAPADILALADLDATTS